jgi:beta-lactamase regulating signal transducer with metallopeptidase domain
MSLSMVVEAIGGLLLRNSLAGAILICLVLIARSLFRNRISPQWMFWLWMLVILRFVTPWSIPSPVRLLNLLEPAKASVMPLLERQEPTAYRSPAETAAAPTLIDMSVTTPPASSSTQNAAPESTVSLTMILAGVWALGAGCVAIFILVQSLYFWVVIRREKPVIRQDVLEILEECKEQLGICTLLCIVQTRRFTRRR